jgi:hypothetical protein
MRAYLDAVFLMLVSCWLSGTLLVDFVVVPSVFRVVADFFNAGELAITLFSKFNLIELVISSSLVAMLALRLSQGAALRLPLLLALASWLIVMVYVFYLTPKISWLTELFRAAEAQGQSGIGTYQDIQQTHQYYHRLYIILDTVKLLLLLSLTGLGVIASKARA